MLNEFLLPELEHRLSSFILITIDSPKERMNDPLAIFYFAMQSIGVLVLVKVDAPNAS